MDELWEAWLNTIDKMETTRLIFRAWRDGDAEVLFLFSALSCYVNLTVLKISRLKMQMFLFWVSHTIFAPCLYARKQTNQVQSACR